LAHRILVVDDEPHIREVICFALDRAGMSTTTAHDGTVALARFAACRPDLIILDIGMPETDGLEVCRQLRKTSDVPILFLSPEPAALVRKGLALDPLRHLATFEAMPIALTAIEFEIIKALLSRPEMVFNRDRIMALAYSTNTHVSDRTIDSHIRNIRSKLALAGCDSAIDTIHGVGFRIGRCEAAR